MLGVCLEDLDGGEVWPVNLPVLELFNAMATQWRVGMSGATGLDYSALPHVLNLQAVPASDWPDLFECLRVMEAEALNVMAERNKNG